MGDTRKRPSGVARALVEFSALVLGSFVTGWVIGTAQYFFAGRIWACGWSLSGGCGLSEAEFFLAFWEGGLIGSAFGLWSSAACSQAARSGHWLLLRPHS